jgi:anti-sigma regulatory factor (Ser/Thr protein kinase)
MSLIPVDKTSLLIEIKASMDNWELLIESASSAISKDLQDESKIYKLKLAYEELISNIIRAAQERNERENVSLSISCAITDQSGKKYLTLQTEDDGVRFDPGFNATDSVDVDQHIDEREIGGLGIFLIKQSVDLAQYGWRDGRNINQISMRIE